MIFFIAKKILKLLSKLSAKNKYEFAANMSDVDAVRNIGYLAHNLRKTTKTGAGVPVYPLKLAIKECRKIVLKKKKAGRNVYPFEEWISDNFHMLIGTLESVNFKAFSAVPHVDGVPRIVVLADFIVKYSAGKVSAERVRTVIEAFNAVTPLCYTEIALLKEAVAYRLLAEISLFAERSMHYYEGYLKAKKGYYPRERRSDSYLTYYAELHPKQVAGLVEEAEFKSAALGFKNLLADNLLLTSAYVTSLRSLGGELSDGFLVALSPTDKIYSREECYRGMSDSAKDGYLRQTAECAVKNNVSEQIVARAALAIGEKLNLHFGEVIYYRPETLRKYLKTGVAECCRDEKTKVQGIYSFLVLLLSIVIAVAPAYYLRNVWGYLSVLPLFIASLHPVEYLLKRFYGMRLKPKPLPQMDYKTFPEECRTVVTVSRFISTIEDAEEAIFQAETLAEQEKDKAVSYAVLADLPSSEEEWGKADQELLEGIEKLPRCGRVSLYLRKRTLCGKKWRGYERKRGALLDFLEAVRSGDFDKFHVVGGVARAEYAILLDDDSELLPGTIRSAVLAMAHPLNKEYDLMNFGGRINRYSVKTYYGLRFLRGCGVEAYPFYSDFYAEAFDSALYCGKAIVRIRPYLEKLKDFFPDRRILSHDIIEGAVLRSTSLKRCVYEDAPASFPADHRRSARWQRGDVQLLPYAFCNRVKTRDGKRVKNPIAPIYKLIIFVNGMTVLRDFMTLLVLLFAYFSGELFLLYYAVSCHLFIKAYALVLALRTFFTNVRFFHALRGFVFSLELLAEEIIMLPFRALSGVYLFCITCVKMAFRSSSLLDWTPFKATQRAGGMDDGAKILLPTVVLLSGLSVALGNLWITLYTSFFLLYAFYLLYSAKPLKRRCITEEQGERLKFYAAKIYRYFEENRDDGLITDNLQLFPYRVRSKMTSPTNLGFALLAEVCAFKIGLIQREKAVFNIKEQLNKIERLEKYCGHLYNWYEVKTFQVMPPRVVSTVDSANFLSCLSVVAAFLQEEGEFEAEERANALISQTDFSVLFNKAEKALAIIRQTDENKLYGRYDLLASESRLAYYFAIAGGIDPECYFRLGRDCTSLCGNTLLSWSGTAFEYMLPRLFLRAPIGSLIAEQEERSGAVQIKDKTAGLFGRSECGYYAFNEATAFLYKAVGCRALALSGEGADVIAPYSTFLYLPGYPHSCIENLKALSQQNAEGEYGFYEAIDFDHQGDVVKSYMTHHQGMSLAAITNALCSDEIVRLFSSSPRINSIRLLLTEDNVYERKHRYMPISELPAPKGEEVCGKVQAIPDVLSVKCGDYSATYDALGRSSAMLGEFSLTKNLDYLPEYGGVFMQIREDDEVFSPSYYPFGTEECYALFKDQSVKYVNPSRSVTMEVTPLIGYQGEIRKIVLENRTDAPKSFTVSAYCDMVLNAKDAYDSHPAFSDMFVSAEYDADTKTQYLYRKNTDCKISIAASLTAKGLSDLNVNCNSYNVIGRKGSIFTRFDEGVDHLAAPSLGDVLYPCFSLKGKVEVPPRSEAVVYLCLLADRDLAALKERNRNVDLAYRSGAIELLGKGNSAPSERFSLWLASTGRLLYKRTPQEVLSARRSLQNELEVIGVAPSDDLVYFDCAEDGDRQKLTEAIRFSKTLRECGVKHKFLVVCENLKGAGMDVLSAVTKEVKSIDSQAIVLDGEQGRRFRSCAKIILSSPLEELKSLPEKEALLLPEKSGGGEVLLPCGEGGFTKTGYAVCPFSEKTLFPYANVVGGEKGGFVITESGGGFTFGENAREDKLTVWTGDAVRDLCSEAVVLSVDGKEFLLNGNHTEHQIGASVYTHKIGGATIRLSASLFEKGKSKLYEIILTEDVVGMARISLRLIPSLGWRFGEKILVTRCENGYELFNTETGKIAYVYPLEGNLVASVPQTKSGRITFTLSGQAKKGVYRIVLSNEKPQPYTERDLAASKAECVASCFSNAVTVKTSDKFLDILNNAVLPYQFTSARLNAKTGFYQCSGAYGFRDQLQDVLGLLLSDPSRVKAQILLSAAHQYREGDVQHWWHPPKTGVRTRVSDDRLWLAYVTERYVEVTGDNLILDQTVPFLSSPILSTEEVSRYEVPREGEVSTLREHILRAIRISLQYGEHGLLKIGAGDWNDGLDRVGIKGRGESVWLTQFAYKVIKDGLNFFSEDVRRELNKELKKLSSALLPLLKDGRYPLAFADDGVWLGYPDGSACSLALNPQTWAVISGAVPFDDAKRALSTSQALVDRGDGLIKLSAPPFDRNSNYGYVAAYPKGIRENGGQYTHAAVWYFKALLLAREKDEAYRVLRMLNPMARCKTREGTQKYKAEPYVLAGDIYGCDPYIGRAGWSWYTGSAAWLKQVLTEDFFGIKKRGDFLYIEPNFPSSFDHAKAEVKLPDHKIEVEYSRGSEAGLYLNGARIDRLDLREEEANINLLCKFT